MLAWGRARNVVDVARPRPCFQLGIVTSPGRLPGLSESLLFHDWGELALSADLVQQVADSIVTDDEIRILCAACSIVAHKIEVLHAHRTIDLLRHN